MDDTMGGRRMPSLRALVGQSTCLRQLVARAVMVASTRWPVLITGESGTGKELVARLIHEAGPCPEGPLVTVNCGTLPRELAESELFGHERGAFTGAAQRRLGWFEEAAGGTLVLDEIGELPLELQPKLLRVLETQRFRRVGGQGEVTSDVRVVASTLRDLGPHSAEPGRFRLYLYHRLDGLLLTLPPLRNRLEDLPLLVESFGQELGRHLQLDEGGWELLRAQAWPGNVRQLKNVVRRAVLFSTRPPDPSGALATRRAESAASPPAPAPLPSTRALFLTRDVIAEALALPTATSGAATHVGVDDLARRARPACDGPASDGSEPDNHVLDLRDRTFADIERAVFSYALARHAGNRRGAARSLSLAKSTFNDRARRYGLG